MKSPEERLEQGRSYYRLAHQAFSRGERAAGWVALLAVGACVAAARRALVPEADVIVLAREMGAIE